MYVLKLKGLHFWVYDVVSMSFLVMTMASEFWKCNCVWEENHNPKANSKFWLAELTHVQNMGDVGVMVSVKKKTKKRVNMQLIYSTTFYAVCVCGLL